MSSSFNVKTAALILSTCFIKLGFSGTLPEYVCVKAAESTHSNDLPSNDRDDNIHVSIRVPLQDKIATELAAGAAPHTLGLHDMAHCWDVEKAIKEGKLIGEHSIDYLNSEVDCNQGLYIQVHRGKDGYIGRSCDPIEPDTVKFFMVDRQAGNVVDYWWCRNYACPLEADGTLPAHLNPNITIESDSCYRGWSYSQVAGVGYGVAAGLLFLTAASLPVLYCVIRNAYGCSLCPATKPQDSLI